MGSHHSNSSTSYLLILILLSGRLKARSQLNYQMQGQIHNLANTKLSKNKGGKHPPFRDHSKIVGLEHHLELSAVPHIIRRRAGRTLSMNIADISLNFNVVFG